MDYERHPRVQDNYFGRLPALRRGHRPEVPQPRTAPDRARAGGSSRAAAPLSHGAEARLAGDAKGAVTMNTRGRPRLPEDQRAAETIQLRVTRRRKRGYTRAARRARKTLTAWATHHLDKAAGLGVRGSSPGEKKD